MANMEKCPFCKVDHLKLEEGHTGGVNMAWVRWFVRCCTPSCYAQGPWCNYEVLYAMLSVKNEKMKAPLEKIVTEADFTAPEKMVKEAREALEAAK